MDAPQVVLVLASVLLIAGGAVGLVLFGEEGPTQLYTVTFVPRTEDLPLTNGAWTASANVAFEVTRRNVTEVTVAVTCTDPSALAAANPATVRVVVAGPEGLRGEASGSCGRTLEVPVTVAEVPEATTSQGTSPEDAVAALPPSEASLRALGAWSVQVSSQRAQTVPGVPVAAPSGEVRVTVTSFQASAQPAIVR